MNLTRLLHRFIPAFGRINEKKLQVSLETYQRLIGETCPVCQEPIRLHAYFGFASAEADDDTTSALTSLSQFIANEDWAGAAEIAEWSSAADVVVFAFLRCTRGDIAVLRVLDASELYVDGYAELVSMVKPKDLPMVETIVADRWDLING